MASCCPLLALPLGGWGFISVVFLPRVKLTSERPRLITWGWGLAGGGGPPCPALCVSFLGVSLSLVVPPLPLLLCPPSLLSNPGETLARLGWQSPSRFGPRRARHGSSRSECRCRPRANDSYEKSTWKHTA